MSTAITASHTAMTGIGGVGKPLASGGGGGGGGVSGCAAAATPVPSRAMAPLGVSMLSATQAFGGGAACAVAAVDVAINENDKTADAINLRMATLLGFREALLHNRPNRAASYRKRQTVRR